MDPEFQRALIVVLGAGTFIIVAGTVALLVIFRRFGGEKAGGRSHMMLIGGLLTFVLFACAALFALSYSKW
jgi:hypothetical protein